MMVKQLPPITYWLTPSTQGAGLDQRMKIAIMNNTDDTDMSGIHTINQLVNVKVPSRSFFTLGWVQNLVGTASPFNLTLRHRYPIAL